jgi:hypothetical protein
VIPPLDFSGISKRPCSLKSLATVIYLSLSCSSWVLILFFILTAIIDLQALSNKVCFLPRRWSAMVAALVHLTLQRSHHTQLPCWTTSCISWSTRMWIFLGGSLGPATDAACNAHTIQSQLSFQMIFPFRTCLRNGVFKWMEENWRDFGKFWLIVEILHPKVLHSRSFH